MEDNIDKVKGLLSQLVRLSARSRPAAPNIPTISVPSSIADESTAPWSWTAAEAVSTEEALIPFLVHLAVARDDVDGLATASSGSYNSVIGVDAVNCFDVSRRSPLHTAALHNSVKCATALLESGALVHLRDSLGHTPLYYAARLGNEIIVDLLVKAGANLGGSDLEGGFVDLAVKRASLSGDQRRLNAWSKTGIKIPTDGE